MILRKNEVRKEVIFILVMKLRILASEFEKLLLMISKDFRQLRLKIS